MGRTARVVLAMILAVGSAGCATTKIVHQWSNADYVAPRFNRIIVIGVSQQASLRRTFEDEFVTRLKAAGVNAVPGYLYIPEDGEVDEGGLKEAVKRANADAAIVTRLVRTEKRTRVSPGTYYPAPAFVPAPALGLGFYPGYSAAWLGYYEPPHVYEYDVHISETSLYDMGRNQMVWTGTVQTTAPRDIDKEIRRYVDTVIEALQSRRLLSWGAPTWPPTPPAFGAPRQSRGAPLRSSTSRVLVA